MTDPWGNPGNHEAAGREVRKPTSLPGIVTMIIGIAGVLGFGLMKLAADPLATPEIVGMTYWIPIIGILVGFVVLYIGFKLINKARGRKGLN